MSNVTNQTMTETLKLRLETLRNFHDSVVRSGEERLRMAMAEYARQFRMEGEGEAA